MGFEKCLSSSFPSIIQYVDSIPLMECPLDLTSSSLLSLLLSAPTTPTEPWSSTESHHCVADSSSALGLAHIKQLSWR
ncbi:unnamed protein product [Brassica rapa subsp. narinosa]